MKCPVCSDEFNSDRAMKIHHKLSHGTSIAIESSECKNCGKDFNYYPSDKKGIYCSGCVEDDDITWTNDKLFGEENPNWNNNYGFDSGENNYNWKGGIETRYGDNWRKQKRRALNRDSRTCQRCQKDKNLQIHHINPRRNFEDISKANVLSNLITLCSHCHMLVEHNSVKCPKPIDSDNQKI